MKIYDRVKLVKMRDEYKKNNLFQGIEGTIIVPEIRNYRFYVAFTNPKNLEDYIYGDIRIIDLEVIEQGNISDNELLEELPKNNPRWWCKVEDGYIMNLLGEKKNKIPYDYNS